MKKSNLTKLNKEIFKLFKYRPSLFKERPTWHDIGLKVIEKTWFSQFKNSKYNSQLLTVIEDESNWFNKFTNNIFSDSIISITPNSPNSNSYSSLNSICEGIFSSNCFFIQPSLNSQSSSSSTCEGIFSYSCSSFICTPNINNSSLSITNISYLNDELTPLETLSLDRNIFPVKEPFSLSAFHCENRSKFFTIHQSDSDKHNEKTVDHPRIVMYNGININMPKYILVMIVPS